MIRAIKLFILVMVIAIHPMYAGAALPFEEMPMAEPSKEPTVMLIAGVGLIGLAILVRKRLVKQARK